MTVSCCVLHRKVQHTNRNTQRLKTENFILKIKFLKWYLSKFCTEGSLFHIVSILTLIAFKVWFCNICVYSYYSDQLLSWSLLKNICLLLDTGFTDLFYLLLCTWLSCMIGHSQKRCLPLSLKMNMTRFSLAL